MELQGKVAWITGGARMGLEISRALASRGCRIVLGFRHSRKPALETISALKAMGADAFDIRCDTTREKDVYTAVRAIQQHARKLDILINLSSAYEIAPIGKDRGGRLWNEHLDANAKSAYWLTLAAAPVMRKQGAGRIIHFSDWTSASGRPHYPDYAPYYVSKGAVKALVEAMALAWAPEVLVNAIAPGPILPPPGLSRKDYQAVIRSTPLRRWGGPAEIAKTVVFLAETDFITGETLRVDGGRHLN